MSSCDARALATAAVRRYLRKAERSGGMAPQTSLTGVWDGRDACPRMLDPVPFQAVLLASAKASTALDPGDLRRGAGAL